MSSHIDHHAAATTRGSAALAHLSTSDDELYAHAVSKSVDGKVYNFPLTQSSAIHTSRHTSFFSPSTALPVIAPAASQVDIRIPAGSCGAVTGLSVRLDLFNDAKTPADSFFNGVPNLFSRIELACEGGSTLLQRWTDDDLRISTHYFSRAQADWYAKNEGLRSFFPNEERTIFLRLPWSVFEGTHLNLASLNSDLYVRLFFRGGASYDSPQYLTLKGAAVAVEWLAYPPSIQRALTARARNSTLDYRYFQNHSQKEVMTLAPSTRYSVRISSMHGLIIQVAVIVRIAGATGSSLAVNHVRPASYELLDSSGKSILGANVLPIAHNDYIKQQQGLLNATIGSPNVFGNIEGTLLIPLSPDVRGCLQRGVLDGYYVSSGYDLLAFTTSSTLIAGQYEIAISWQVAERLRKDGGRLSVHSS